jgi:putative ABC transport system permease protein
MIKNYFKIAWRSLVKQKVSTVINILGLSIGISACLIIYMMASFELSYDNFHPDKDRIFRVVSEIDNFSGGMDYMPEINYFSANVMRNQFTGVDKLAVFFNYYAKIKVPQPGGQSKLFEAGDPSKDPSDIIIAEPQYFDIFKYTWLAGNAATALNGPLRVVLTESKARMYFGSLSSDEIIGKEVIYNDSLRLTVSGIVKDYGINTNIIFKDFISFSTIQNSFLKNLPTFQCLTHPDKPSWSDYIQEFVKLSKGTTPAQIEAQTAPLIKMTKQYMAGQTNRKTEIHLQSLPDIHFDANYGSNDFYSRQASLPALYGLMGIAVFILIIASINFINLSSAQSIRRAKEIGIRKVLGSSRASLILQFLSETFIITVFAVVISLLVVNPVISAFKTFIPDGVTLNLFKPSLIIFLILITLCTSLLAGFYPAKVLSSYLPVQSLKGQQKSNQKSYLLRGLIVFQFTVSLIFIIGTIIIGNQIHYVLNKDMGFNKNAIINININGYFSRTKRDVFAEKIKQLSGVEKVSICRHPPAANNSSPRFFRRKDNNATILSDERLADENYVPLYGLKLLAGRNLTNTAKADSVNEFLVTATCAKQLGFKTPADAIGHLVEYGDMIKTNFRAYNTGPIVGVLADFHNTSLYAPISPVELIGSLKYASLISIKLSSKNNQWSDYKNTIAGIERQWKQVFPDEKFDYSFYDKTIASFYQKDQRTGQIMNTAMLIAIFISCMGLFGLVTFTAEQRTKEIGIRKVLGASVANVTVMLAKEFVILIGIAFLIASPIAWYFMHKWLQDFAFRISISLWIFVLAGLSTILIALITISYQSIKAALANPVKSLRSE